MERIYINTDCLPELKKHQDNAFDIGVKIGTMSDLLKNILLSYLEFAGM